MMLLFQYTERFYKQGWIEKLNEIITCGDEFYNQPIFTCLRIDMRFDIDFIEILSEGLGDYRVSSFHALLEPKLWAQLIHVSRQMGHLQDEWGAIFEIIHGL